MTTDNRAKAFIRFLEMRTGLKVVEVNVHIQGVSTDNMEAGNQNTEEDQ